MAVSHEVKTISTAAGTVVLSLLIFYFTRGIDLPTRTEVSSMIQKESPYIRDQHFIMSKLADNSKMNESTTALLSDLRIELEKLRITLDNINARFDRERNKN